MRRGPGSFTEPTADPELRTYAPEGQLNVDAPLS
jgi:hypothetical protein